MLDISLNEHNQEIFLEQFPLGSFLQGRFWKHFLELQDKKSWQLNVYDSSRLVAHCLLYTTKLPFGKSYLYAPKGPLIASDISADKQKEAAELILSQIRDITIATRKREEIFCRLEPNIKLPKLKDIPMRPHPAVQPKATIYLKLNEDAETTFASFKEKTRYNIRLAEKKGVTVHWSTGSDGIKHFLSLANKTSSRQKIRLHDKKYYSLLVEAGKKFNAVHINWAEYQKKVIASNIYIVQHPTMTYIHGGFHYKYRNIMAPHLLQWEAIKFAYDNGIPYYDFWGYTPSDGSKPHWEGFSKFKTGFNGTVIEFPGSYDYIYNSIWYNAYSFYKKLRRRNG